MPPGQYQTIDSYIRTMKHDVRTGAHKKTYTNLGSDELRGLETLRGDKNIIIKPADKGGAIVIMDYAEYRNGMLSMLADTTSYEQLTNDPTHSTRNALKSLVDIGRSNGWISQDTAEFLINEHPRLPVIYGLPKIHKGTNPLKFRPIVSGSGSITQPLAQWIDYYLQPLVKSLPAYIRDTNDFLDKLASFSTFDNNWLLATMDISSLYTSIPNMAGLEAVRHFLSTADGLNLPVEFLIECLHFVLDNNFFAFEGKKYSQIRGTAMGSSAAPSFANLFVGYMEECNIFTATAYSSHVKCWFRFIDDVFLIWDGDELGFFNFVEYLNGIFLGIVFNPEISAQSITYLDVKIVNTHGSLNTTLFTKPTDRNTLLHYQSAHPKHLLNSLPISQFKRVLRICSSEEEKNMHLEIMYKKFMERGYPTSVLDQAITKATMNSHRTPKTGDRPLFIHKFNHESERIRHAATRNLNILKADDTLATGLKSPPMLVHKRGKSLRDLLVQADPRSKYTPPVIKISQKQGCYRCYNCNICNSLICGETFAHPHSGKQYRINGYVNCNTEYCVYLLKCPCSMVYVGKTIGPFKRRFQSHRSDIKTALAKTANDLPIDLSKPVAVHFTIKKHQVHELRGMVIEHVDRPTRGGDRDCFLLRREAYWIHILNTVQPRGLNSYLSFTCFLDDR